MQVLTSHLCYLLSRVSSIHQRLVNTPSMRQLSIGVKLTRRHTQSLHALTSRDYGGTIQKEKWSTIQPCLCVNTLL